MKITGFDNNLTQELIDTSHYRISAIKAYMKSHRYTQNFLASKLSMTQGAISKLLSEDNVEQTPNTCKILSYQEACRICDAMGSTLGTVLHEYDQQIAQPPLQYNNNGNQEYSNYGINKIIPAQCNNIPNTAYTVYPSCLFAESDNLVNNINDPLFLPWFGKYHCYFYSTLSSEDTCFHGTLEIPRNPEIGCCHVNFDFTYGRNNEQHKKYYGQLVLSRKSNGGAYCTLVNHDDQGEISYLVMSNPTVKTHVCCVLALVATISGGKDTRHPCSERMIISREPLDGPNFELAKVHLLLNDKKIRITESAFRSMLENEALPESFKQRFPNAEQLFDIPPLSDYTDRIAEIPEYWVKSLPDHTEQEQQKIIDFMRMYSLAPKYNKIKEKTSENDIYEMYKTAFEQWHSHTAE